MFRKPELGTALACALIALAVIYFVVYPEDLTALTAPVEQILSLSYAISPWLYLLLGICILARTITSIWGRQQQGPANRMAGPQD
jgi:hypothetical protein